MLELIRARLRKPAYRHILLGDFNQSKADLTSLNLGLHDAHEGLVFTTRVAQAPSLVNTVSTSIRKIDFILHTGHLVSRGYSEDPRWQDYSDHRPIWAIFPSSGPRMIIKAHAKRRINLDLTEPVQLAAFREAMRAEQFHFFFLTKIRD